MSVLLAPTCRQTSTFLGRKPALLELSALFSQVPSPSLAPLSFPTPPLEVLLEVLLSRRLLSERCCGLAFLQLLRLCLVLLLVCLVPFLYPWLLQPLSLSQVKFETLQGLQGSPECVLQCAVRTCTQPLQQLKLLRLPSFALQLLPRAAFVLPPRLLLLPFVFLLLFGSPPLVVL